MKIFKYDLHYYSVPELVRLPFGATIISVGLQEGAFKLWALVDENEPRTEDRIMCLAMTGTEVPWDILEFYGTHIVEETGIVVHALELDENTTDEVHDAHDDERFYPREREELKN